jgi:ubiquinone/menaquinone biosynthesis C-methylase UbiE
VQRVVGLCTEGLEVSRVLDVGTGSGIFAGAFAGGKAHVTGIDPDPGLLSVARDTEKNVTFIEGVAESLPFEDSSFDLVFLGHVLHETDDPLAALREARRVVRSRVAVLEWPYRREEMGPPLEHRLEASRIADLARSAGYASIERIELRHMVLFRMLPRPSAPARP